jgi:hypothetical protein
VSTSSLARDWLGLELNNKQQELSACIADKDVIWLFGLAWSWPKTDVCGAG